MKIEFAPSFFESLKKLSRQNTWWYKSYEFIRYDIPWVIRNFKRFWKLVWNYRPWDYSGSMALFSKGLSGIADTLVTGYEIPKPRGKKIVKIRRAVEIMDHLCKDSFIDLAEKKLGYEVNSEYLFREEPPEIAAKNKAIFDLARDIEESEYEELWTILKGNKIPEMPEDLDSNEASKWYDKHFDGTGIRGWWD
jgi:hypothetical protein